MHLTVANEPGIFQSRDHAEDPLLFFLQQVGLKTNQVAKLSGKVILPQLKDCPGTFPGPRID